MEVCERQVEGIVWRIEAPWAEPLRGLLPLVPRLASRPEAHRLKKSIVRTVFRLEVPEVIVKHYHRRRAAQRLKALVLGPTPLREWRISQRLVAAGVPVSHAVAVGVPRSPFANLEGYLIVEAVPGAVTVNEALAQRGLDNRWTDEAAAFVERLARFVRSLHHHRVSHRDLHCGNVLVRLPAWEDDCPFVAVDLHRMRLGRKPGIRHKRSTIALLLRTCRLWHTARQELLERFLDVYLRHAPETERSALDPAAIAAEASRQHRSRMESRTRRCLRNSTRFVVEQAQGWRIYHRRDYTAAHLLALLAELSTAGELDDRKALVVTHTPDRQGAGTIEIRAFRGDWLSRLLPPILHRPRGLADYLAAHRHTVQTGRGPLAVAALVGMRGDKRGRSVAVLKREDKPQRDPG